MKTLKQWYDSLSADTQQWVQDNCSAWFDVNQADYYRKAPEYAFEEKDLRNMLICPTLNKENTETTQQRMVANKYAATLHYLSIHHPDIIDERTKNERIFDMTENSTLRNRELFLYISDPILKKHAFKRIFYRYTNYSFEDWLYTVKDYNEIILDETCAIPTMNDAIVEIIGKEQAKSILNKVEVGPTARMIKMGKPNELFDEMFFCDKDMTQHRKYILLNRLYCDNDYMTNLESIRDFFKRIVAVDHSYMRFIYDIIYKYPSIAMKLYNEKKPADEIDGANVSAQYRYSPEVRKLFVIAHMCVLKRTTKTKASIAKEVSPLLKIYGYNFHDVYDALYPEDGPIYN